MHDCGERVPPHVSEVDKVGFTTAPSRFVAPPRIAEAPVAFECRLWETLVTQSRQIFIGPFTSQGALDEAMSIARQAGFIAPFPPKHTKF